LAQEGQRWNDLKRSGRAVEVMNNLHDVNLITNVETTYDMNVNKLLLPIPQGERNRNLLLGQNEGYGEDL
jgi:hypothetical protein